MTHQWSFGTTFQPFIGHDQRVRYIIEETINDVKETINDVKETINDVKETIRAQELRFAGRTKNSIITRGNVQNIEPLFVDSGHLPINYLTTRHELRSLNGEEVRELLSAYDIRIASEPSSTTITSEPSTSASEIQTDTSEPSQLEVLALNYLRNQEISTIPSRIPKLNPCSIFQRVILKFRLPFPPPMS
ncbi:unnamed protein product [Rhizophagus irregularis]|uniref:Uncharacterized protein n=1 Tax=Rhizophagus irregularis TaxID=588596 RepID=A0A916E3Y6_9GLOM|nr:unnamed protein product [Rhizophagus irregularis]